MPPPSPDGPRVSKIRFSSKEGMVGCPFDIIVHLDSVRGTLTRARAAWTRVYGRSGSLGEVLLLVEPGTSVGYASDELAVRIVPERSGNYHYYVQFEDEQGRRSNILVGEMWIPKRWRESASCPGSNSSGGSS
jgi:hypothetical protein